MESERTLVQQSPSGGEAPAEELPTRRIARRSPPRRSDEQTLPVPARAGAGSELVLGRYTLTQRLGSGGFGVVWRAHDELLNREVAVKRIWLGPEGDRERATREAQATARLSHPAIVALYEACVVEDAFYLISELVEGDTLAQLIADDALEDEEVLEIGLALSGALAHAHARGVIHRDIKPHNVLIPSREGEAPAKLTDFGGASLAGEEALTRTGDVLGTLAYMAPEQSEGAAVAEEADLYALALVLYESLSGINPVRGATPAASARRIGRPLESLARRRRDLPRTLTSALDGALAPMPEDRGSLEHLRLALHDALEQGLTPRRGRRTPREPSALRRALTRSPAAQSPTPTPTPTLLARPSHLEEPAIAPVVRERPQRLTLPRAAWIVCALGLIGWQAVVGHAGVALLILVALLPLIVLPAEPGSARVGAGWLICALAPVLGLAGLAGAFPALAGQGARWRERLVHGALGYWWLSLAAPLAAQLLWLPDAPDTPARGVWEGSIAATASHVIAPLLTLGVLLGALLWGAGAVVLPWLVRGRSAVLDALATVLWSTALVLATPELIGGLHPHTLHPAPRGLILGAVLGGLAAVGARALRGPV